jgi:hypothetical protein
MGSLHPDPFPDSMRGMALFSRRILIPFRNLVAKVIQRGRCTSFGVVKALPIASRTVRGCTFTFLFCGAENLAVGGVSKEPLPPGC